MNTRALILSVSLLLAPAFAAGPDGTWKFTYNTPAGTREGLMTIRVEGEKASAKSAKGDKIELSGTFKENNLALEGEVYSSEGGYAAKFRIAGKVDGETMKGDCSWGEYQMTFTAQREKQ